MAKVSDNSSILFASSGFVRGMSRALDLGGTLTVHNYSADGNAADFRALSSDWHRVGEDIRAAMGACDGESKP